MSHDGNMVVMENDANVVHQGSMDMSGSMGGMMNQIPEGWTDLGNGLYEDENGNQHQERVFYDLLQFSHLSLSLTLKLMLSQTA